MWGLNKVIFSGDRSNVGFGIIQKCNYIVFE